MAQGDNLTNQNTPAGTNPVNSTVQNTPAAKIPSSPWEEDVDVPETPPKNKPTVVGSFDKPARESVKPFAVPQNITEPVGQKGEKNREQDCGWEHSPDFNEGDRLCSGALGRDDDRVFIGTK